MSAVMYSDQDRAFHYALLLSLALHAVLLFGFSALHEPTTERAAAPGPIVARLVQPGPPEAPAVAPQREPIKPQLEEKPLPAVKPTAPAKPHRLAKPATDAPATVPQPSVAPAETAAPASPAGPATGTGAGTAGSVRSGTGGAASGTAVAKAEPGATAASPSLESFDAGSLAQYRLQLISAARKYKRYPRLAMDNNWQGDVVVRMVIGANGMISALSIKSSSGYDVLDQQAIEMFKRAKPLVQIPPALRGRQFTIELRAIYSLKDQESS